MNESIKVALTRLHTTEADIRRVSQNLSSAEGILREIIRNAQVLRKEADFNIDARIKLSITTDNAKLAQILEQNKQKIMQETLATDFNSNFEPDIQKEVAIDEGKLLFRLKSLKFSL